MTRIGADWRVQETRTAAVARFRALTYRQRSRGCDGHAA